MTIQVKNFRFRETFSRPYFPFKLGLERLSGEDKETLLTGDFYYDLKAPVAQLVEHRAVMREVVSSTPAGPTLKVFK